MRHQGQVKSLKNHKLYEDILPQRFLPYCIYITKQKRIFHRRFFFSLPKKAQPFPTQGIEACCSA
jgi:hypothetical protein